MRGRVLRDLAPSKAKGVQWTDSETWRQAMEKGFNGLTQETWRQAMKKGLMGWRMRGVLGRYSSGQAA